jgi:hypothetical protein
MLFKFAKRLLVILGLCATIAFAVTFFSDNVKAELDEKEYEFALRKNPHHDSHQSEPRSSNINNVVDDVLAILLKEGFAGAIIIILFAWTFRVDKANRQEQKEQFNKITEISGKCTDQMAQVSVKLENFERELEGLKTMEMMRKT